jgi:ABC-type polysaccharide/polyol phosphate export permease
METARPYRPSARGVRRGPVAQVTTGIREIWSRRRLARYLVRADLTKKGSNTLLGNIWWVLDPLLQMAVYVVLVSVIFKRTQEAYPLFIFSAILPWKWFTTSIGDGVTSVTSQERIIKQVQFPKLVLPVAAVLGGIVSFGFGMIPLAGLLILFYPNHISAYLLLIPVVAVVQFVFTLALAIALSAGNVFFRDIGNLSRHVLRLWFYLSPALYGADQITSITQGSRGDALAILFNLNPWTAIFESYRNLIYYGRAPEWLPLLGVLAASLVLCALAIVMFKRVEPSFAKVL